MGRYPVAIHFWSATGEAWAYHPDMASVIQDPDLNKVFLDRQLPPEGKDGQKKLEQWCVLWHRAVDPNCPDPKAVNRQPTILRMVGLPRPLRPEYRQNAISVLKELSAGGQAGKDAHLVLEIPEAWLVDEESGPSKGELRAAGRSKKWMWIAAMGIASFLVGITAWFVLAGIPPVGFSSEYAKEVHEKLLVPLGVSLAEPGDANEVRKAFVELYSKLGMIKHYFPNASPEEVLQNLTEKIDSQSDSQGGTVPASGHPDIVFFHQKNNLASLGRIVQWLPDKSQTGTGAPSWIEKVSDILNMRDSLTRAVIKVAKTVPVEERGLSGPDRTVTASNAIEVINHAITAKIKDLKPQEVDYKRWFLTDFVWEAGTPFPWDYPTDSDYRAWALMFTTEEEPPTDVREAAREMKRWLDLWGVKGVDEADIYDRPWFIGRCFVEFLSQKHLGLTDEQRKQLDEENSYVWYCLRKLPREGWISEDEPISWQAVHNRLVELAKSLGISMQGSDAALVSAVATAIDRWQDAQQRIRELSKRIDELENDLSATAKGTPEYGKKLQELTALNAELASARSGLVSGPDKSGLNEKCNEFRSRLVKRDSKPPSTNADQ